MMRLQEAYYVANAYDANRNRILENREIKFTTSARQLSDSNRDGYITVDEFAYSLMRGDVYVATDKKVYANAYQFPSFPTTPMFPYFPYQPYFPTTSNIHPIGGALTGAAVGGVIGALIKGVAGLKTGAIIGGALGLIGGLVA